MSPRRRGGARRTLEGAGRSSRGATAKKHLAISPQWRWRFIGWGGVPGARSEGLVVGFAVCDSLRAKEQGVTSEATAAKAVQLLSALAAKTLHLER